jgi:uncharacterized membrane protein
MSESARFILATLCGLALAVAVHIVIVMGAPRFAEHDAFSRLSATMHSDHAEIVSAPGGAGTWLMRPDPTVAVAACAFDLSEGPMRISTKVGPLFESLSFHSQGGAVFYAVTDRAAVRGELELVLMTPRQLDEALAADDESEPSRDVRIVSPRTKGFVIVRVAVPFPSQRAEAEAAAKAVSCAVDAEEGDEG